MDFTQFLSMVDNHFDIGFMLIINMLTYAGIKIDTEITKRKAIVIKNRVISRTWQKRIILVLAMAITWGAYLIIGIDTAHTSYEALLVSTVFAPVFWSWVLKPLFNKIGFGHSNKDCKDDKTTEC
jgi:hypothetical protein